MSELVELKWKRAESSEYPRVWHTFQAKDVDSDNLVEYCIQDFPESRFADGLKCMAQYFCRDEPLCQSYDLINDPEASEDHQLLWKSVMNQKLSLVCFKKGSDEIVGMNLNFILEKGDNFMEKIRTKNKSAANNSMFDLMSLLCDDFDTFERYDVDKYLTSLGLVVVEKYRGRGIGEQFLRARKPLCHHFGIKLSSTTFTSNFSNRLADKAGYKLDKSISYDYVREKHPEFKLGTTDSDEMTIKSIQF